jgi:alkylation response protein AidB-like acyl-CoA dehydrogenase
MTRTPPQIPHSACRTEKGFSLLLIERNDNLTTTPIKTSYSPAAGTAYILYENVKVRRQSVIGIIRTNIIRVNWRLSLSLSLSTTP